MRDLIDRQAAIEIIQSMYPGMPRVPWMRKDWRKRYEPYIRTEKAIRNLPSAQFKRINKGTHEITESDKISYSVICDKFPSPHIYFNTYDEAERWAKFDQPNDRPFYIVKRSEHFEIVGEIR